MKKNLKTRDKVCSILSEILKISIVKADEDIEMNKVPQWDSVAQLSIISSLEDEFKIQFSSTEISKLTDLKSIIKMIENKSLKK